MPFCCHISSFFNFSVFCADQLHSVPIAQMGNYQDFLKAAPQPLRDADPEQPKRLHTFGNPFKLDKKVADSYQPRFCFISGWCNMRADKWEPFKLTVSLFTPPSGHDDRWGWWVRDRPSEQREETRGQQQHAGWRAQETALHVAPAAPGTCLHPSSDSACKSPTNFRSDLHLEFLLTIIIVVQTWFSVRSVFVKTAVDGQLPLMICERKSITIPPGS